jgi:hypothetical protein
MLRELVQVPVRSASRTVLGGRADAFEIGRNVGDAACEPRLTQFQRVPSAIGYAFNSQGRVDQSFGLRGAPIGKSQGTGGFEARWRAAGLLVAECVDGEPFAPAHVAGRTPDEGGGGGSRGEQLVVGRTGELDGPFGPWQQFVLEVQRGEPLTRNDQAQGGVDVASRRKEFEGGAQVVPLVDETVIAAAACGVDNWRRASSATCRKWEACRPRRCCPSLEASRWSAPNWRSVSSSV